MRTYSDEYIEFFGDLYLVNHAVLQSRCIFFETFLQDPYAILAAAAFNLPMPRLEEEFYCLLPSQQRVADKLFEQECIEEEHRCIEEDLEKIPTTGPGWPRRDNGRLKEPMAHHAHPARRGKRCAFTPAETAIDIDQVMQKAGQCIFFKRQAG